MRGRGGRALNNAPGTVVTLMDTSNARNVFIGGRFMKWDFRLGGNVDKLRHEIGASRDAVLCRIQSAFPDYRPSRVGSCCVPYAS